MSKVKSDLQRVYMKATRQYLRDLARLKMDKVLSRQADQQLQVARLKTKFARRDDESEKELPVASKTKRARKMASSRPEPAVRNPDQALANTAQANQALSQVGSRAELATGNPSHTNWAELGPEVALDSSMAIAALGTTAPSIDCTPPFDNFTVPVPQGGITSSELTSAPNSSITHSQNSQCSYLNFPTVQQGFSGSSTAGIHNVTLTGQMATITNPNIDYFQSAGIPQIGATESLASQPILTTDHDLHEPNYSSIAHDFCMIAPIFGHPIPPTH